MLQLRPAVLWIGTGVGLLAFNTSSPSTGAGIRCCCGCFVPPPAMVLAAAESSGFVVVLIERSAGGGASRSELVF